MRIELQRLLIALSLGLAACAASAADQRNTAYQRDTSDQRNAQDTVQYWPAESRKAARAALEKYGHPDEVSSQRLVWQGNGPWKRTVVTKEETTHAFPLPHKDVLEQVINYRVPPDKFDDLARFDGSITVDRTKGELAAHCDKEESNLVALNLANDVITGQKSVEQARYYFARALRDLMAGKRDPYAQKLRFSQQERTADADQTAPMHQAANQ